MSALDFSQFKKIGADKNCTTLRHKDGHDLKIMHKALNAKSQKQLEEMPVHEADGGSIAKPTGSPGSAPEQDASPYDQTFANGWKNIKQAVAGKAHGGEVQHFVEGGEAQSPDGPQSPAQGVNIYVGGGNQPQQGQPAAPPPPLPEQPKIPAPQVQAPPPAQTPQTPMAQPPAESSDLQTTDFQAPQNVQDSLNQPSPMQSMQQKFAQDRAGANEYLKQEDDKYEQDLANGHITPKTYQDLFHDKSTPGKIGTLLGLLVSGAGSGLAHQQNAVMGMMDKVINNDLQGQIQSKQNAQNFLRLNQADLANKTNALGGLENAKTAALARTQAQLYQTSFHHALQYANTLPPDQQEKFRTALRVLYPEMKGKINNFNDIASGAMAANGVNPFNTPGSIQAKTPNQPNKTGPSAQSKTKEPDSSDHLLRPGASESFTNSQYDPRYNPDAEQVKRQLETASLADKAIDAINKHLPQMFANVKNQGHETGKFGPEQAAGVGNYLQDLGSDALGYVNRRAQDFGGVPYIGKAIEGLGTAVTNTQKNRDYDIHRAAITPALQAVLTRSGMSPTEAEHAIDSLLPEIGDSPQMAENKRRAAIEKIIQATPHDALDRHFLTRKGKK